ncbi:hypothetical protein Ancab_039213 [Ancistrocladus abbreviatus]
MPTNLVRSKGSSDGTRSSDNGSGAASNSNSCTSLECCPFFMMECSPSGFFLGAGEVFRKANNREGKGVSRERETSMTLLVEKEEGDRERVTNEGVEGSRAGCMWLAVWRKEVGLGAGF